MPKFHDLPALVRPNRRLYGGRPTSSHFRGAQILLSTNAALVAPTSSNSDQCTFACWYYMTRTAPTEEMQLIYQGDNSQLAHFSSLRIDDDAGSSNIQFNERAGGATRSAGSVGTYKIREWHHAVGRRNAQNNRDVFNDYWDLVNQQGGNTSPVTDRVSIGAVEAPTRVDFMHGFIFLPAIWDIALADNEILALQQGADPLSIQPDRLLWVARHRYNILGSEKFDQQGAGGVLESDFIPPQFERFQSEYFYLPDIAAGQTIAVGQALENDDALPATVSPGPVTIAVGQALENDDALPATVSQGVTIAVGQAAENDDALPATVSPGPVTIVVGQALENDDALPATVSPGPVTIAVGQALENDDALPATVSPGIVIAVGQAAENDDALPATVSPGPVTIAVGQALENDDALPAAVSQGAVIAVGQALENDDALPATVVPGPVAIAVGQALETDDALPVTVVTGSPPGGPDTAEGGGSSRKKPHGGYIPQPRYAEPVATSQDLSDDELAAIAVFVIQEFYD